MNKLKEKMVEKNIYTRELSEKTRLDIARLSKIVNSLRMPNLEEIKRINKVLNLSLEMKDFKIDQERKNKFNQAIKAFNLVYEDAKNKTKGSVSCPACDKRLNYVKHYNGHIWAQCETENCIKFMQ